MKPKLKALKVTDLRTGKITERLYLLWRGRVINSGSVRRVLPVSYNLEG